MVMDCSKLLIPQNGTWVTCKEVEGPGIVIKVERNTNEVGVLIRWLKSKRLEWKQPDQLGCGFVPGMAVQDVPASRTRTTLGEGIVLQKRTIGGQDQVLVDFPVRGEICWLPFHNLKQIKGVEHRFELGQTGNHGNAERFRLRSLAHAIEMWDHNTGSLSRLDIDPLPHQIHLVHHILASGNLNWLIADDVGLGKTIEVGMLLSALLRGGTSKRILLVTPAGLVKQWKDELHHKFGMNDFLIYGEDFYVKEPRHWKLYDHVIGSVDKFKLDNHAKALMQAGSWNLVVFDEAHRLSRIQSGIRYRSTERFRLAAALREKTDSMLLLTGTPHQGKQDKFQSLLELIRPDLKDEICALTVEPNILKQMVIRNSKADVTDAEGNFIFRGKVTTALSVRLSKKEMEFDSNLLQYLRKGYAAGARQTDIVGRAIGFVMTIYRKLAASSIAAIKVALSKRVEKLKKGEIFETKNPDSRKEADERYLGEWDETFALYGKQFFVGEIEMLEKLIQKASELIESDHKIEALMDNLIISVLEKNPKEKIVIFTEYRATQEYLSSVLTKRFGLNSVSLIHGGQNHSERTQSIVAFEEKGHFLISTEAGGEGINLQRKCHIMINYDLPWNPMRLVQRVGRLYRYGQQNEVIVFNMHAPETMDGNIVRLLYERIENVVQDMSVLGGEFRPGLEADILGEVAEAVEVENILERAPQMGINRTRESIKDAIIRAREAVKKQRDLLKYAAGYDPNETSGALQISMEHVQSFLKGIMSVLGFEVIETTHKGNVFRIRIPEEVAAKLDLRRQFLRITLNRNIAANRKDIMMMDLDSPLFQYFLSVAKSYNFDGRVAKIKALDALAVISAILRWQNEQGVRTRQEYNVFLVMDKEIVATNPDVFLRWMLNPAQDAIEFGNRNEASHHLEAANKAMDSRLNEIVAMDLYPQSKQTISAAWCEC